MFRSQKRTVVSPLPLARRRPSGEKLTDSTASVEGEIGRGRVCNLGRTQAVELRAGPTHPAKVTGQQRHWLAEQQSQQAASSRQQRAASRANQQTCVAWHGRCAARDCPHAEHCLWLVHHPKHRLHGHLRGSIKRVGCRWRVGGVGGVRGWRAWLVYPPPSTESTDTCGTGGSRGGERALVRASTVICTCGFGRNSGTNHHTPECMQLQPLPHPPPTHPTSTQTGLVLGQVAPQVHC